jgi:hypothetical protein
MNLLLFFGWYFVFMEYSIKSVLPSLPLFLIFPLLIDRVGFWMALFAGSVVPIFCLYLLNPNIILIESKRYNLLGTMRNLK